MANQLDLRDLGYFEVIAETGHLGQAARKLFRSQPALSGCVDRLERVLGTALFVREGRGIRLTPAGEALLVRARALRIAAAEAVQEISDVGSGAVGHVRIGVLPTLATFLFPAISRLFLRQTKDVRIKSQVGQNDILSRQLKAGELDVIVSTRAGPDEGLVSFPVCADEAVVIASHVHPILRGKATLRRVLDYRWVLAPPDVGTRLWLEAAFHRHGLPPPNVQIEANLILMMPALIEETEFLTFTSRKHARLRAGGPQLREVTIPELTMPRQFDAIHRRDGYLSPAAARMVQLLRDEGARLFEAG